MSYYLNPSNCSKLDWLTSHGREISKEVALADYDQFIKDDNVLLCYQEIGVYQFAAGLGYSNEQIAKTIGDDRTAAVFAVPIADLIAEGIEPTCFDGEETLYQKMTAK